MLTLIWTSVRSIFSRHQTNTSSGRTVAKRTHKKRLANSRFTHQCQIHSELYRCEASTLISTRQKSAFTNSARLLKGSVAAPSAKREKGARTQTDARRDGERLHRIHRLRSPRASHRRSSDFVFFFLFLFPSIVFEGDKSAMIKMFRDELRASGLEF